MIRLNSAGRSIWSQCPVPARSHVLQTSPIHEGLCDDPARALDVLFQSYVIETPTPPPA